MRPDSPQEQELLNLRSHPMCWGAGEALTGETVLSVQKLKPEGHLVFSPFIEGLVHY